SHEYSFDYPINTEMKRSLHRYLIPTKRGQHTLFSRPEDIAAIEVDSTDRVRQFIHWISNHRNRVLSWIGCGIRSLHKYYVRLEDKIHPNERVLKAMASVKDFVVYTSNREAFRTVLKRQRWKHTFWFSIDFVLTGIVILFTPILAPIPGPNLFFYY